MQGCEKLFHMLTIWFLYRHFGMESVPDPLVCFLSFIHLITLMLKSLSKKKGPSVYPIHLFRLFCFYNMLVCHITQCMARKESIFSNHWYCNSSKLMSWGSPITPPIKLSWQLDCHFQPLSWLHLSIMCNGDGKWYPHYQQEAWKVCVKNSRISPKFWNFHGGFEFCNDWFHELREIHSCRSL